MTTTNRTAQDFVIECVEAGDASRHEYDVEEIVSELYSFAGSWDFERDIDHDTFWATVARHQRVGDAR